ncbi:MAG TPA: hypothetical protein VJ063_10655 [Verrucomicrobiae bacterium]|nr:hypothetical protein [Verrucomicrobiae bacterium]
MGRPSITLIPLVLLTITTAASAQVVAFQDNFESGNLSLWTSKTVPHQGRIVPDPLDSGNHVLTFTGVNSAGDIFSAPPIPVSAPPARYILSFDFLALSSGGTPSEYGGFAGITTDPAGFQPHYWIAGTYGPALNVPSSVATILSTNGQWRHYEIDFTDIIRAGAITQFQVMLEDWYDRGSVPGDVFFDNVKVLITPFSINQLNDLIAEVENSALSSRQVRPLLATLHAAAASAERGDFNTALNQLRAFQQKVQAQISRIDPELASTLIQSAQDIIDGGTIYDLSRDFSIRSNPSGAWTYGYTTNLGTALIPFRLAKYNYDQNRVPVEVWAINSWEVPAVQRNNTSQTVISDGGQGVYPPGTVWFYPGPSTIDGSAAYSEAIAKQANFGVLRFTAPKGGTYALATALRSAYTGPISGDTDFHVLLNNRELFGQFLPAQGRTVYNTRLRLLPGDTVDFVIGRGRDNSYHGSGLIIDATLRSGQ